MSDLLHRAHAAPIVAFDGSRPLRTQITDVSDAAWTLFVRALTINDDPRDGAVGYPRDFRIQTAAGGFGCFDLRPLRLADIGLMRAVRRDNTTGRLVVVGEFVPPITQARFLFSPLVQYNALLESIRRFDRQLVAHSAVLRNGLTRSGVLALCHRLGPNALRKWARYQEATTAALFARANLLF